MRHRNQTHKLGVTSTHRKAMLASLSTALIEHGRIRTTLAKAKALRPFIERLITYAKKAQPLTSRLEKYNYKQLALAKLRDKAAVEKLFDEWAGEFMQRKGGYTRIYKLGPRRGDAAPMALIEFVKADDVGYEKRRKSGQATEAKSTEAAAPAAAVATEESNATAEVQPEAEAEEPKAETEEPKTEAAETTEPQAEESEKKES
ncbi:MAG: 50S ribosomal protein L17 [Verrucomicrobiota bacterium]